LDKTAMVPPTPPEASKEIEFVRSLVAKRFPVYDVRVSYDVVQFFCRTDPATLEDSFEQLRMDMAPQGYIPMITYQGGEHIVQVARKPKMKYRSVYVNLGFFIVTFLTMVLAGVLYWDGYAGTGSGGLFTTESLEMGIVMFTVPLMAILAVHELGHFFMARRRHVAASLPFFIPSIPPLGTFGAFISLRDPMPNKKALLEIGAAGPLCGLALAVPLGIIGLIMTNDGAKLAPQNIGDNVVGISFSLIFFWLTQLIPVGGDYLLHPVAFAAWVGILVTAINLLPVGQLDGGHIARALLGNRTKYLSYGVAAFLVVLSLYFTAWIIFAMLVLILGVKHPPPLNDISPLGTKRKIIGVLTFAVLVVSFVPQPMFPIYQDYRFEMTPVNEGGLNGTIVPGGTYSAQVLVNNTGNTYNVIRLSKVSSPLNWNVGFKNTSASGSGFGPSLTVTLNASEYTRVDVLVSAPRGAEVNTNQSLVITAISGNASIEHRLTFNMTVETPALTYWVPNGTVQVTSNSFARVSVILNSTGDTSYNLTLSTNDTRPSFVNYMLFTMDPPGPDAATIDVTIPANGSVTFGVNVSAGGSPAPGTIHVDILLNGANIGQIAIEIQVAV
jgi:Zn-dependent protease